MTATATVTLYELGEQMQIVAEWIEEHRDEVLANGGELPPALAELLEQVEGDLAAKIERVALFALSMRRASEAAQAEADRLSQRAKVYDHAYEAMRRYVQPFLASFPERKVKTPLVTVREQANPPAIRCALSPEEFWNRYEGDAEAAVERRVSYHFRSRDLLAAYKRGEDLPPEFTVEQASHVRIA